MVVKGLILCFSYKNEQNDYVEEMLRIIIYDFVSTNIYLITRLEANIFVSCFYFLLNLSLIILGLIYSNKNRFYGLEGMTSLCVFVIFYALRKQWDYYLRLVFAEKSKFEKYFTYTMDYLEGLNGYNLNVQNNRKISYGLKIHDLIRKLITERYINYEESKESEQPPKDKEEKESRLAVDDKELQDSNMIKSKEKVNSDKKGFLYNLFFNEFDCFADEASKNENKTVIWFLKKLIFLRKYELQKDILKIQEKTNNNSKAHNERFQSNFLL